MKSRGVTAEVLGNKLGLSRNTIYAMFQKNNFTISTLERFATALECEVIDFFPCTEGHTPWGVLTASGQVPQPHVEAQRDLTCPYCGGKFTVTI